MSSSTAETEQFHHFASIGINYLFSNKTNSDIRNIAPNKYCFVFAISPADCLHLQTTYKKITNINKQIGWYVRSRLFIRIYTNIEWDAALPPWWFQRASDALTQTPEPDLFRQKERDFSYIYLFGSFPFLFCLFTLVQSCEPIHFLLNFFFAFVSIALSILLFNLLSECNPKVFRHNEQQKDEKPTKSSWSGPNREYQTICECEFLWSTQ